MLVTYLLNLAWIGIFVLMVVVTFIYSTYSMFCDFALVDSVEIGRCISFKQVGKPDTLHKWLAHTAQPYQR